MQLCMAYYSILSWWLTVLLSSTSSTPCSFECSPNDIMKRIVGDNDVGISCPLYVGESHDSLRWFIKRPNQSDCGQMEFLMNGSTEALSLSNISKDNEGKYYCRPVLRGVEFDIRSAKCLYVSGRATLQCREDSNCNKALEATEQQNVTFNASVEFKQGGELITQPIKITFFTNPTSSYTYSCNGTASGCVDSSVISIDFARRNTDINFLDISLSLMNLSESMSGVYFIRLDRYDFSDPRISLEGSLLTFNLSVIASPATEITTPPEETMTTAEMPTTEAPPITLTLTQESTAIMATPHLPVNKTTLIIVLSAVIILFFTVITSGIILVIMTKLKAYCGMCNKSSPKYNIDMPHNKDDTPTPPCTVINIDREGPKYMDEFLNPRPQSNSINDDNSEEEDNFSRLCNSDLISIASSYNDPVHLTSEWDSGPIDV